MSGLSHLDELEAEAIYIIREVAAECENPVMLYSIGKDSSVMLVFGGYVDKTKTRSVCIKFILGIECNDECTCKECLRWWDEEYKEPEKEKEE